MKLIFAGTPTFSAVALQALLDAGHEVLLVLTQPDRPAGRGMKLHASEVKKLALAHNIHTAQPHALRLDASDAKAAQAAQTDIAQAVAQGAVAMVVVAYGLLLPQWVLDAPPMGCLNIHASLLPRWRGAAPIHRAIQAGDATTGVAIMQMDVGLDTGDVLHQAAIQIVPNDTTASLHDKLAALGAILVTEVLIDQATLLQFQRHAKPQIDDKKTISTHNAINHTHTAISAITYAHKIRKDEAHLNWTNTANDLVNQIRAFNPFPIATVQWGNESLKVWSAHVYNHSTFVAQTAQQPNTTSHKLGMVLAVHARGIEVQAQNGTVLCITEVQKSGGKRMEVAQFLHGHPQLKAGEMFC